MKCDLDNTFFPFLSMCEYRFNFIQRIWIKYRISFKRPRTRIKHPHFRLFPYRSSLKNIFIEYESTHILMVHGDPIYYIILTISHLNATTTLTSWLHVKRIILFACLFWCGWYVFCVVIAYWTFAFI